MNKKIKNNVKAALAIGGLVWAFSAPVQADLNTGLIAHYSFDDCTAKDSSINALDGTIEGDPTCVNGVTLNGVTNKALSFNGNDRIVRLLSITETPFANYTVSVWVKSINRTSGIFSVENENRTGVDRSIYLSTGKLCNYIWSDNSTDASGDGSQLYYSCTNKAIASGFNHLVIAVTDNETRQYVNGILVKRTASRPSEFDWSNRFYLGSGADGVAYSYFNGILDEFRYYNRVLSASEIAALYSQSVEVSGTMKGLNPTGFAVQCQNVTTGQTVAVASVAFNCEAAGLVVNPNDVIHINIDGKAK